MTYEAQTFTFSVDLLAEVDILMERGAVIGRQQGLDDDWVPQNLNEALVEIILQNERAFFTPVPKSRRTPDTYTFDIVGAVHSEKLFLESVKEDCDTSWMTLPRDIDDYALAAFSSPLSPADHHFEIINMNVKNTHHDKMNQLRRARINLDRQNEQQ